MAKKGNIDPAMQAAPYLGDSTHDPIAFSRRQNFNKYQAAQKRQKEKEAETQKGLDALMLDLKGWEDQAGFKEIMKRQDNAINLFMKLSKDGLNLTTPKTNQDVTAFKAITDYHAQTKQIVDTWGRNKKAVDLITTAITEDAKKPLDQQKIDHDATRANTAKELQNNDITGRNLNLEKLLVFKPQIGDWDKYIKENANKFPVLDTVTEDVLDEETGTMKTKSTTAWTPDKIKEARDVARSLYRQADEKTKKALEMKQERERAIDPNSMLSMATPEEFAIDISLPQEAQKFTNKTKGSSKFSINFLGQKANIEPGTKRDEPLPYGDKTYTNSYLFKPTTKPLVVPVGAEGSAQFMGNTWMPVTKGGTVEATLYLYDPQKDEFVFNTTSNNNAPWVQNNTPISVPRSVIGNQADDLPIMIDGKMKKLKDIYGTTEVKVKTIGGMDFSQTPYIPKNKK